MHNERFPVEDTRLPRELTSPERAILDLLLAAEFPGCEILRQQAEGVRVSGRCGCGCATRLLKVDPTAAPAFPERRRIPVEAEGVDADGVPIYVLLHVVDGYLNELEMLRADSEPLRLPDPQTLIIVR
jgi:hypothetical protein